MERLDHEGGRMVGRSGRELTENNIIVLTRLIYWRFVGFRRSLSTIYLVLILIRPHEVGTIICLLQVRNLKLSKVGISDQSSILLNRETSVKLLICLVLLEAKWKQLE